MFVVCCVGNRRKFARVSPCVSGSKLWIVQLSSPNATPTKSAQCEDCYLDINPRCFDTFVAARSLCVYLSQYLCEFGHYDRGTCRRLLASPHDASNAGSRFARCFSPDLWPASVLLKIGKTIGLVDFSRCSWFHLGLSVQITRCTRMVRIHLACLHLSRMDLGPRQLVAGQEPQIPVW